MSIDIANTLRRYGESFDRLTSALREYLHAAQTWLEAGGVCLDEDTAAAARLRAAAVALGLAEAEMAPLQEAINSITPDRIPKTAEMIALAVKITTEAAELAALRAEVEKLERRIQVERN